MTTLSRPETEARPDLIPEGPYESNFIKILEIENKSKPNPKYPEAKWWPTKYSWHFEITQPNEDFEDEAGDTHPGNWQGLLMKGRTNPTVANEKATGYQWLQAIIKRALLKGEDLDDQQFTGYPCVIEVSTYEDDEGSKWNYIKNVARSRRGKMLPLPAWAQEQHAQNLAAKAPTPLRPQQPTAKGPGNLDNLDTDEEDDSWLPPAEKDYLAGVPDRANLIGKK